MGNLPLKLMPFLHALQDSNCLSGEEAKLGENSGTELSLLQDQQAPTCKSVSIHSELFGCSS